MPRLPSPAVPRRLGARLPVSAILTPRCVVVRREDEDDAEAVEGGARTGVLELALLPPDVTRLAGAGVRESFSPILPLEGREVSGNGGPLAIGSGVVRLSVSLLSDAPSPALPVSLFPSTGTIGEMGAGE